MKRGFILVVEDEPEIREGVREMLTSRGYQVGMETNGREGLESAIKVDYDLLLLDLGLPQVSGLEILASVREARPTAPVIIMTAMDSEEDRVNGLELGADDYVTKPFSLRELIARIEAVLRRSPERPQEVSRVDFPGGYVDTDSGLIHFEDGTSSGLSPRELDFLSYVARNSGRVISRAEILTRVYRINPRVVVGTRTVDMLAARVRKRLRDDAEPHFLQTVRSRGYLIGTEESSSA